MTMSNEAVLNHIMNIKDIVHDLDRERSSSIEYVRRIALQLQGELAALSASIDSVKVDVKELEDKDLTELRAKVDAHGLFIEECKTTKAINSAVDEVGVSKTIAENEKAAAANKNALRVQWVKTFGTIVGGATGGAAVIKLLDWISR